MATATQPEYDLICVGFGPAALAIAVAIRDLRIPARVLFLEKQQRFAWHSGMLLPGAKMQISFLKDLATFRDPKSQFTFLNYLKENDRLEAFTNLSTFLPLREEFNDYLTWAANQFEDQVRYDTEAESIAPLLFGNQVHGWEIYAQVQQKFKSFTTRNIVIATGGSPQWPEFLHNVSPRIAHSSRYLYAVPKIIPDVDPADLHIAVVGSGQSSAETFQDLTHRYPTARVSLFTSGFALKPSDDSPFVNEIFNPSLTTDIYSLAAESRMSLLHSHKSTNYSVVRPELLEELYAAQYRQRLKYGNDPNDWRHRIIGNRRLVSASTSPDSHSLNLVFENTLLAPSASPNTSSIKLNHCKKATTNGTTNGTTKPISHHKPKPAEKKPLTPPPITETVNNIDLLILGTGYNRNTVHTSLLDPIKDLLAVTGDSQLNAMNNVTRTYKLRLRDGVILPRNTSLSVNGTSSTPQYTYGCGIWLQGLCEQSHGLSDSLLSVLAVRAGEVVSDIFGVDHAVKGGKEEGNGECNGVGNGVVQGVGDGMGVRVDG